MRTTILYAAPVAVSDVVGEPVLNPEILTSLSGITCLEGSVLEYFDDLIDEQEELRGGYLRLKFDGKHLRLEIEIDSPRELKRAELSKLRNELDGQVTDGLGEGAFDFVEEDAGLAIEIFPEGNVKSSLTQSVGEAWIPGKASVENSANRRRCKEAGKIAKSAAKAAASEAKKASPKKTTKVSRQLDPKKLFRLIEKGEKQAIPAEIDRLGGDLSFIKSGIFPDIEMHDRVLLRLLLDAGLNPNLHDREGHSLLWSATGRDSCVKLLLEYAADPNLRNKDVFRETPLIGAAWAGDAKSVRLLLEHGADPALKTNQGENALAHAKDRLEEDEVPQIKEVIRILSKATKPK